MAGRHGRNEIGERPRVQYLTRHECREVRDRHRSDFRELGDLSAIHAVLPGSVGRISLVETTAIGISSSDLRRRVAIGAPIRHQVPIAVEEYIARRGLYR